MKSLAIACATVGTLALSGLVTTMPAQARHFGPGFAGGVIAGALVAGAVSSAYAYGPGYAYYGDGPVYDGPVYYGYGPGYYGRYRHPYQSYGVYNDSQHGGQPSY